MVKYLKIMKDTVTQLESFSIKLVPRNKNMQADALSKLASSTLQNLQRIVMVEVMENRSIDKGKLVSYILSQKELYDDMLNYKLHGEEPGNPKAAKRLRREEHRYVVY